MKIKSTIIFTYINGNTPAHGLLFFTDEIDRDIVDKIVDYLKPFDNNYDLEKYFNTEVFSNCIIITTTRGIYYLRQIRDNIERIANYEAVIPIYIRYPKITSEKDVLKVNEKKEKNMDNRFNLSRTQFDCGTNKINNFQIDVYFGSSKEEEINRIIFVEYVKDAFAKLDDSYKKKSINTSVNNIYGVVKITVSGFRAKDYTDLVKSVQTRMNRMDLKFDMDDIINIDTGKISVNRKKVVDKKFSALDDKVLDCLDHLEKHGDPLRGKLQAIQFDITELWNMIIEDEYLDEHKE